MIEARAQVVDLRGDRVRVRVDAGRGGCGRCNEPGGCGGARLSELFGPNRNEFEIENTIGALRGEEVVLCIAEDASLKAALVGYGLPVVCVIAGAAVGTALAGSGSQDAWALFGALAGVALAMFGGRRLRRREGWNSKLEMHRAADRKMCSH
ncbi:MAG: SoxR reducing system RseC family protein [Zoogloeaceae bacterium]|nr:SoxR reducing system RseC family protein [Zoogloeaceae bacterium]